MLSTNYHTQSWLSQFTKEHKKIAAKLLDNLIFISSSSVVNDLKDNILEHSVNDKIALLPIRELAPGENVYDADDKGRAPLLNSGNTPLGSEAFISNLYMQLHRKNSLAFPLNKVEVEGADCIVSPSINYMRINQFSRIVLVDDLIGSGDRVVEFLSNVYNNKTIKSWLSLGVMKIEVLCFMATRLGRSKVEKFINNKKGLSISVLYVAPTFHDLVDKDAILSLCKAYANHNEKKPLGYNDTAIRVVFTHSAPNNLPTILYRPVRKKYKPKEAGLNNSSQWVPLFPNRYVGPEFESVVSEEKTARNRSELIFAILKALRVENSTLKGLSKALNCPQYKIKIVLQMFKKNGWVACTGDCFMLTPAGLKERTEIRQRFDAIAQETNFYYPYS